MRAPAPLVGIGYRHPIGDWICAHLDRFDVIEVTVDHYIHGGSQIRSALESLARRIPIVAHGVGLSLGTDAPLDEAYVREIAHVLRLLRAPRYSEHLAFTRVPGLDLANLLPLPRTPDVVAWAAGKARRVRSLLPVPFDLENISYLFDWPDASMTDGQFLTAVCEAVEAGILLDVENVYVNARNHDLDAVATLAELPAALVHGIHIAGGCSSDKVLIDSHDHSVPDGALDLLGRALARFRPGTIVLERDDRIDAFDEILADVARIRACVTRSGGAPDLPAPAPRALRPPAAVADLPLIERQRALLEFLTRHRAAADAPALAGLDSSRLRLVRDLSIEKRLDKIRAAFPITLARLDQPPDTVFADFVAECPPRDIGRAENARQFATYLVGLWRHAPPRQACLPDVLKVELAMTLARRAFNDAARAPPDDARPAVRRTPSMQLLQCDHDVRPLFDPSSGSDKPAPRRAWLAILPPASGDGASVTPRVIEISAELHAALMALTEWRPCDPTDPLGIGAPPEIGDRLIELGVLEVAS